MYLEARELITTIDRVLQLDYLEPNLRARVVRLRERLLATLPGFEQADTNEYALSVPPDDLEVI